MGLLDRIRRRRNDGHDSELRSVIMGVYGGNVQLFAEAYASSLYNIPEVRTAIECFSDIFASVPMYVERVERNGNIEYFEDSMSRVLTLRANPLQNATQFWKDVIKRLLLDNNVFIKPHYDTAGKLKSLFVLPKQAYQFKLGENSDSATVTLSLDGRTYDMRELIYLNRFATISGGKETNLGLYQTVVQSLAQQAINVADPKRPKAFLKGKQGTSPHLKPADKSGTMDDLKMNMDENVRGIAYLDGQWDVMPINWQENDVNRELMQFVINIVYNYFGITTEIINNKATEIEYQLFVRNKIEPIAQQIERELTSKLFTQREIEFGNRIELDTFNLTIGTMSAKAAIFNVGLRQGVLNIDDAREMIGLAPLPDGLGQMNRTTLDTVDIEIANEMQLQKLKGANGNETKADN